ncbi:hypothetical protein Q8G38_00675 [Halomonas venusta]|uniref:hypothetical protein n=1 Tax=Vreelandella venusta TaxID=44935 RepID=UPI00295F1AAC|nr:hypothetical protein [Halomonas venusta]MDW0357823.1 hypothetical protein [Halomonas venusta]
MKKYILLIGVCLSGYVGATDLPLVNHVDQCGGGSRQMSDDEMSIMLQCVIKQRDAMGILMGKWRHYPEPLADLCISMSVARDSGLLDYVALKECLESSDQA